MRRIPLRPGYGAAAALAAVTLAVAAGCGSGGPAPKDTTPASTDRGLVTGHATRGSLSVTAAYLPAPPPGGLAAAYFTVTDTGAPDRLLSVTAAGFRSATLHHYADKPGGGQAMVPVRGPLAVSTSQRLVLQPGGYHLMLAHPSRRLHRGMRVRLTLTFARTGRITVQVPVDAADGADDMQMSGGGGGT